MCCRWRVKPYVRLAGAVLLVWAGAASAVVAEEVNFPFYDVQAVCALQETAYREKCRRQEGLSFEKTRIMWPGALPYVKWSCLRDNTGASYVALQKCLRWRSSKNWTAPPEELPDKAQTGKARKTR